MARHPDYPGVSSFNSRGTIRWRYRAPGTTESIILPGQPGDADFVAKYEALTGKAKIVKVIDPTNDPAKQTFREAWRLIIQTSDYIKLDWKTKEHHDYCLRSFFDLTIEKDGTAVWADVPVADMTYDDLEMIKDRLAHIPSRGARVKTLLKMIFRMARRKGWRVDDPTDLVRFKKGAGRNGKYIGHKPWPAAICEKYEAFHAYGTPARTAYELARWIGTRRGDVATVRWDMLHTFIDDAGDEYEAFVFEQSKQVQTDEDMTQVRPYSEMLRLALEPTRKPSGFILTKIGRGKQKGEPYSVRGLSDMMRHWCQQAGIEQGWTLHGLRKSYAAYLATSGASLWAQKDMLGHTTLQQVADYARTADKNITTRSATRLIEDKWRRERGPLLKVVAK